MVRRARESVTGQVLDGPRNRGRAIQPFDKEIANTLPPAAGYIVETDEQGFAHYEAFQSRAALESCWKPFDEVAETVADASSAHEWASEFFAAALEPAEGGVFVATVPMMGGRVRYRQDVDFTRGVIDVYIAPQGGEFGSPLPVRVIPNGDGADVLWTWRVSPARPTRRGRRDCRRWSVNSVN